MALEVSITYSLSEDPSFWIKLTKLYEISLGPRDLFEIKSAFQNSKVKCFVFYENDIIGAGRALSDGIYYTVIFDVVVHPDFQRKGIGKKIIRNLIHRSGAKNVLLQSVPGKEPFYQKLGFHRLKTAMGLYPNPDLMRERGYIE
jgi:ribosomal protein S18 acetylase RimI-like enzyme